MNPLSPYLSAIRTGALIAMLLGSGWLGWEWRDRSADIAVAEARADANRKMAESAAAETAAVERARAQERDSAERINRLAEAYEQDKRNAEESAAATIAGLRAGSLRLRQHWQGCVSTGQLSGAAASASTAAANARLREEGAAEDVRAGREADDWIKRLQQVTQEDRK